MAGIAVGNLIGLGRGLLGSPSVPDGRGKSCVGFDLRDTWVVDHRVGGIPFLGFDALVRGFVGRDDGDE